MALGGASLASMRFSTILIFWLVGIECEGNDCSSGTQSEARGFRWARHESKLRGNFLKIERSSAKQWKGECSKSIHRILSEPKSEIHPRNKSLILVAATISLWWQNYEQKNETNSVKKNNNKSKGWFSCYLLKIKEKITKKKWKKCAKTAMSHITQHYQPGNCWTDTCETIWRMESVDRLFSLSLDSRSNCPFWRGIIPQQRRRRWRMEGLRQSKINHCQSLYHNGASNCKGKGKHGDLPQPLALRRAYRTQQRHRPPSFNCPENPLAQKIW